MYEYSLEGDWWINFTRRIRLKVENFCGFFELYINKFFVVSMYRDSYTDPGMSQFNPPVTNYSYHPNQPMKISNT